MSLKYMLYEVKDHVAIMTFNRPEALNALSPEVVADLGAALDQAAADPDVRVIILTGAGEKAFVAGADIKVMSQYSPLQAKNFAVWGQAIVNKLGTIPQPVIACVNGFALGGGCEIALACDFIYAADTARFGQPEIGLGIIPGFGGTQRLTRRVGLGWAKELCLSGVMISAAEAKEIGLVNRIFPKNKLMEETLKTAKIIAAKGRVALREAKTAVEQGCDMDLLKALAMEADRFTICFTSPDQKEGMNAFIEKRKPEFKGQL